MAHPFDFVTEAIAENVAAWDPQSAKEALRGIEGLKDLGMALEMALRAVVLTFQDKPAMETTIDALAEMTSAAGQVATLASEHAAAFKAEHAFWLDGDD